MKTPTVRSSVITYSNNFFKINRDELIFPDGLEYDYQYISAENGVSIVALDDDEQITLVREYRHPTGEVLLALPSGGIEPLISELESAKKELEEEVGLVAESWHKIGDFYPSPGTSNYKGIIYLAREISNTSTKLEKFELIESIKIPFSDAVEKVYNGEIKDAWAIIPILQVNNYLMKIT
jgi:ADP-ribose pyrophosphatase